MGHISALLVPAILPFASVVLLIAGLTFGRMARRDGGGASETALAVCSLILALSLASATVFLPSYLSFQSQILILILSLLFAGSAFHCKYRHPAVPRLGPHEVLFQAMMNQRVLFVYALDISSRRIIEVNKALADALGYPVNQLLQMQVYDFVDHSRENIDQQLEGIDLGVSRSLGERRYRKRDGSTLPVEVSVSQAMYEGRDVLLVFSQDISLRKQAEREQQLAWDQLEQRVKERTSDLAKANRELRSEVVERRRAEDALKDTEDVLDAILRSSSSAIVVLDRDANVAMWNQGAQTLFGYEEDEVLGRPYPLVSGDEWELFLGEFAVEIESGMTFSGCEVRHLTKSGQALDLDMSVAPLRNPDGQVIGEMRFFIDITHLKGLEDALEFRLGFDDFVNELSGWLAVSTLDDVGMLIEHTLGEIGRFLEARDVRLTIAPDDRGNDTATTYIWHRGAEPEIWADTRSSPPYYVERLFRGEVVMVSSIDDLTSSADDARSLAEERGVASFLAVPVLSGDRLLACIEIGSDASRMTWSTDITPQMKVIGEIVISTVERKRAEQELRHQHDFLRQVIDTNPNYIFTKDRQGRYTLANRATAEAYGTCVEDMIGKTDADFHFTEEEAGRYWADDLKVMNTRQELFEQEHTNLDADGNPMWVQIIKRPIEDGGDCVEQVLTVVIDITPLKLMEEAYRESTEQYKGLYNNAIVGLVRVSFPDGNFLECNRYLANMIGFDSPEEAINNATIFGHMVELDTLPDILETLRTEGHIIGYDMEIRCLDGRHRWVRASFHLTADGAFVDGVIMDVTEEKRAETERRRLAAAIEQTGELISITDLDGTVEYINKAFRDLMGYSLESVRQVRLFQLAATRDDQRRFVHALRDVRNGKAWKGEVGFRTKNGQIIKFESSLSPLRDKRENIVNMIAVARDITRQSHLEEQLRQAQKMEAVGRLAGGVAHDFNNLLTGILGNLQLMELDLPEESDLRVYVDGAIHTAERAADLTGRLLTFSRKAIITPEVLDLNAAIDNAQRLLTRLLREDIKLETVYDSEPPHVRIDKAQLEQVILNLAVNARDAMPEGGKLIISAMKILVDGGIVIQEAGMSPGPYCMLSVTDTGFGMDADTLEHLYEPFYTSKGDSGTGLGLATVYSVVKQNSGYITCASGIGEGTVFRIYFPEASCPETVERAPKAMKGGTTGDEVILVVEDEPSILATVVRVLRKHGYHILEAASAEEALSLLEETDCTLDMLLTDVILPGMTGRELADRICAFCPDIRVLYTSGYTDDIIAQHGMLEPGINFIQKPYPLTALLDRVREVLDTEVKTAE